MSVGVTRPILRYHGGKWRLAKWIESQFPPHRQYIEPFGGGGSVLLRKTRAFTEVYNDLDGQVVNVFKMARDRGEELAMSLELTPFSRSEFEKAYETSDDPLESARRTIVRSFMGFGSDGFLGKHRTGFHGRSERSGTTPAHDWMNLPEPFRAIIQRLRGVVIENRDALDVIRQYDQPTALFYVDPPYPHSTRCRTDKARGYKHEMTDEQHRELAGVLSEVKGAVILSGYPCDLYDRELYDGWERIENTGPHCDGALERTEVLWLRNVDHGLFPTTRIP